MFFFSSFVVTKLIYASFSLPLECVCLRFNLQTRKINISKNTWNIIHNLWIHSFRDKKKTNRFYSCSFPFQIVIVNFCILHIHSIFLLLLHITNDSVVFRVRYIEKCGLTWVCSVSVAAAAAWTMGVFFSFR